MAEPAAHTDEWFDRFVSEILAELPTLDMGNQWTCRMCYRTYVVPCLARDCELDHVNDEPGCHDDE
jgi:hypothetical protein